MSKIGADIGHLLRLGLLFVVGTLSFLVVRAALVPDDFGELGFYRAGAIDDAAARAPLFAGRQVCGECHEEVVDEKDAGAHSGVGCESCHGPLGTHAEDPGAQTPELPNPDAICLNCHRVLDARPEGFPQILPADHAESDCAECHLPHSPGL